jgi:hypothetical protein
MPRLLEGAKVALLYGPGNLAADYAGGLLRGLERGLLELGASVATLNLAFFKSTILGGDLVYADDAPLVVEMARFLEETWPGQQIDLCFGLFHDAYLRPRLKEALRARCKTVINYPLNLLDQPHRFTEAIELCDLTFCSEEEAHQALSAKHGSKVKYVPMAADPYIFRPIGSPATPRLLFVGSLYADRLWLLDACSERIGVSSFGGGHDLKSVVRGIGRELIRHQKITPPKQAARMLYRSVSRDQRIVSDEELVRLAAEHGVSIGFSEVWQERTGLLKHKVRLREYEYAMLGLCHLARRLPELQRGFEDGKEILLYESTDEALDLLSKISRGAIDWRSVGKLARARAEREHTWTVRLAAALS